MAVDIPDAATIWRELGEFQTVLDSYVKQQSDLSDRLRKSHLEFCQDHKRTFALDYCSWTTPGRLLGPQPLKGPEFLDSGPE